MEYRDNRKSSFVLYYASTEQLLENFNDSDVGRMFRALAHYEMYGELPPDGFFNDLAFKMVFTSIKNELDRNYQKWIKTCKRNKQNRNGGKSTDEAEQDNGGDEP